VVPGVTAISLSSDSLTPAGAQAQALVDALNDVAASDEPRRIFPLYGQFLQSSQTSEIVGFVSARVVEASRDNPNAANETLSLVLEPEFVVHFTAETARTFTNINGTFNVPENIYIHKIRLVR
jgi:hypothetical protein